MVVVRGGGGGVGIYFGFDFDVVEGLDVVVGVVGEADADVRFAATFCNILLSECVKGIFIVAGAVVFAMTDFVADLWPFCTTFSFDSLRFFAGRRFGPRDSRRCSELVRSLESHVCPHG
jgi:hypothetical protein